MFDDILRDLRVMQQQASSLQAALARAQAQAPRRADGADATGAVRVTLGPDGLPATVTVSGDWARLLRPAAVGGAVVEAYLVAARGRTAAWFSALDREGWPSTVEEPDPSPPEPPPAEPARRDRNAIAADVLQAFDQVDEYARRPGVTATGTTSNRTGTVTITLSTGALLSCVVEEGWAARQSGPGMSRAIDEALDAARAALTAAASATDPTGHLDELLGEALALISEPRGSR
jgi:hypothetical protein